MKKLAIKITLFSYFALLSPLVLAKRKAASIGSVASNLYLTIAALVRFMWLACIIVGVVLVITSIVQIRTHYQNPKLVPMSTPVTYFLLGLFCLGLPFVDSFVFGSSGFLHK